jgi:hypothetical protein
LTDINGMLFQLDSIADVCIFDDEGDGVAGVIVYIEDSVVELDAEH